MWFIGPSNTLQWIYDTVIVAPLRQYYFKGSTWGNQAPEDICNKMTGVDSAFWARTPETLSKCRTLMEREFQTWSADRLVYAQITLIITIVVNIIFCCCCSRSRTLWGNAPVNGLQYIIVPPSGLGASQPTITLEELRTLFMQMKQSQTQWFWNKSSYMLSKNALGEDWTHDPRIAYIHTAVISTMHYQLCYESLYVYITVRP